PRTLHPASLHLSLTSNFYHSHRHLPSFPTRRSSDLAYFRIPVCDCGPLCQKLSLNLLLKARQAEQNIQIMSSEAPVVLEFSLRRDRKSTRLNSSHGSISYAVFCLKKKKHGSLNYTRS